MTRDEAVQHFGSVIKLGKAIGITPQGIYQWRRGMPLKYQLIVQQLTDGALKAEMPAVPVAPVAVEPTAA